jgi:hypothetical protein
VYANNYGDLGNVGDGNGDSNGNDGAASANGDDVDDDVGGDLRMAVGQWQFYDNDGSTTM